tara:strand:- start:3993 stop:4880 length:888 start_codon:yes stop_codon:yes gene_type:complete
MDNINISPSKGFSHIYNNINAETAKSPVVLVILTIILICYFLIFDYLDVSVPTQTFENKSMSFIELLMWGLIVFLVLINGMQYFFKMDVKAAVNNLISDTPEIDLKINNTSDDTSNDGNDKTNVEKGLDKIASAVDLEGNQDQVFHVSDNTYTYEQARAVCKAYKSKLANYSQVEDAYKNGAEWCGYGWSDDQMALFPTQKKTYDGLQKIKGHEHDCGRPGINGGYMKNEKLRFGVNCFGKRPEITPEEQHILESSTPYPLTVEERDFNKLVRYYKEKLPEMMISPYNYKKWSKV